MSVLTDSQLTTKILELTAIVFSLPTLLNPAHFTSYSNDHSIDNLQSSSAVIPRIITMRKTNLVFGYRRLQAHKIHSLPPDKSWEQVWDKWFHYKPCHGLDSRTDYLLGASTQTIDKCFVSSTPAFLTLFWSTISTFSNWLSNAAASVGIWNVELSFPNEKNISFELINQSLIVRKLIFSNDGYFNNLTTKRLSFYRPQIFSNGQFKQEEKISISAKTNPFWKEIVDI